MHDPKPLKSSTREEKASCAKKQLCRGRQSWGRLGGYCILTMRGRPSFWPSSITLHFQQVVGVSNRAGPPPPSRQRRRLPWPPKRKKQSVNPSRPALKSIVLASVLPSRMSVRRRTVVLDKPAASRDHAERQRRADEDDVLLWNAGSDYDRRNVCDRSQEDRFRLWQSMKR